NLQSTIRDLQRRKARGRRGLAVLEGVRLVEEALAAGLELRGAVVTSDLARTTRGQALASDLASHAVPVEEVGARTFGQLAGTETPQGILAVVAPRVWTVADVSAAPGGALLVVDGVQDPGNLGTLIRTAHALGAAATMVLRGTADPVIIAGAVALGLCFGSFLNVCILRLPRDQSLLKPRSRCPHCKQPIAWRDNIPVFSWLRLRGKCRWCHKPISVQYPVIEALVGVLFGTSLLAYGMTLHAVAAALLGTLLLGIAITDARHYIIPDEFTWGGLVIGLLLALGGGVDGFLQALL